MLKYRLVRNVNLWSIISLIVALLIVVPNLNIMVRVFERPNEVWYHIQTYLLPEYIRNTLVLIGFTAVFTIIIGVTLAWIVSIYDFPLRKIYNWGLVLPLAIPPYIAAYTYGGLLSYTGSIRVFLRNINVDVNPKYFDIMSMEGTIFIFTLFMFPYIYIISKAFLEKQSASLIETSRMLGRSPLETFFYVGLPLLRNSIIGGVILVVLEVLNDYGVVKYFGVTTFSTAIFTAWFSFGDVVSAIRLAVLLMLLVITILVGEKLVRGRKRFSFTNTKIRPLARIKLTGFKAYLVSFYAFIILSLGFLIPISQLFNWSLLTYKTILNVQFIFMTLNTFINALVATLLIVFIGLIIANYSRLFHNKLSKIITRITTLGYSIPGAVIAISVITSFIALDQYFSGFYRLIDPQSKTLLLTSSIYMLIFAYVIRYMAIGYNTIETGFEKMGNSFTEASRTLGMNKWKTFVKVDIPMLKPSIISALMLVFIDVLKELPLTLILRPFNYNSLATKTYEYANDEMIHEASIPALIIIILSILSIVFLNRLGRKAGNKSDN